MLNFDTLVIGGGLAGYCAAIKSAQQGLKTALISQGEGSLHFASGSIDVLAKHPTTFENVRFPLSAIEELPADHPHPYRKIGALETQASLDWFNGLMADQGIHFHQLDALENHWRITPFGTLKATWLSQVFCALLDDKPCDYERVIIVGVDGFRDFQPAVTAENIAKLPQFAGIAVKQAMVVLPETKANDGLRAKRAIDYARALREPLMYNAMRDQLMRIATPRDLVIMPSVFGNGDGQEYMARLQRDTHLQFHEVPTMPPSLLGIRIADALHRAFVEAGGTLLKGDAVTRAQMAKQETVDGQSQWVIERVHTRKMADLPLSAKHIILASGSFFSHGLVATADTILEPVFGLDVDAPAKRDDWYADRFLDAHPYIRSGVITDDNFAPSIQGTTVSNLSCIGGVLAGFDPVKEGSGGGISIATGFAAAHWHARALRAENATIGTQQQLDNEAVA
uniref:glycerol-3-phosphate dehydrogenase subunit GlpB n=1 Tax=Thaumasiovibrio occultus TaxID=1891184 RepID=UPI000B3511CE|nr:glycerol-3-phosphate dehydrogenase subunit GlpB [Thaumasiovibrio occultus]